MGNRIGSISLDDTAQGSVRTSNNMSGGEKFAQALGNGVDAVGGIADNLATVLPGGSAVLSAVSSGLTGVTGSVGGAFGGGSSFGGMSSLGGGGGFGGAMGGGSVGGIGGGASTGGLAAAASGKLTQVQMLNIQEQQQRKAAYYSMMSALLNIMHQTEMSIIQNIH
ncbi:MAG: hypothetical protein V4534_06700 [Myxococcota bacterium]